MRLIYDSGPLTVLEHIVALIGAMIVFGLGLLIGSIPFLAIAQNGLQLGILLASAFAIFMSALLFFLGVHLLAPVLRRFSIRVYLIGSQIEVRRPFPRKMMDQFLDGNRINTIDVLHQRKGGSNISVLYRFGEDGPSMNDSEMIGPFYRRKHAEAVAAAIQAELLPENFDTKQNVQYERFNQRMAFRMIFGAFVIFELIVCSSFVTNWNKAGKVDGIGLLFMAIFPLILWYAICRNIKKELALKAQTQSQGSDSN